MVTDLVVDESALKRKANGMMLISSFVNMFIV